MNTCQLALPTLLALLFIAGCDRTEHIQHVQNRLDFNDNWQFFRDNDTNISDQLFDSADRTVQWEDVSLPHSAYIEPLVIEDQQWLGTAFYRKIFTLDERYSGKHIAIRFGAAMHLAEVYLNGGLIHTNTGGYLPFVVDISDKVLVDQENVLVVRLNNEDNPLIPPGKPIAELDFNWFSGIYREVTMIIKDRLHISDPILAGRVAGGGLLVSYEDVSSGFARVQVQTDVQNDYDSAQDATVTVILQNADGKIVAESSAKRKTVAANSYQVFHHDLEVSDPELWSPDNPYLYKLSVQLIKNGQVIDSEQLRIGIRTFSIDPENGFVLNGERLFLRGTNRHQEYPYIGYALSRNAQYRDAYKIKQAGFNFIRTAHYPPDPAFLEALDELGILFMNAIPGWQFVGDEAFQANSFQDIRDMIRRDRNHPCIIIWEASLNESGMTQAYMDSAHAIVNEELPISNVYTSGWIDYAYDIFIPARQHARPPDYWSTYSKEKPILIAEYGDWEYYAHNAGFNQDAFEDLEEEERNSRQLRGFGQKRLAQQALNFQEAHNSNLYSHAFGDANWVMYDYNRGYAPDLEASGIMDIFRIPKFAYYFYQSQAVPETRGDTVFNQPVVYIANYWSEPGFTDVKVYSNAEEIELYLNDILIERRTPDDDRVSSNLNHPPFTFDRVTWEPGVLRAVGYLDGEPIAEHEVRTPGEPESISLSVDYSNRQVKTGQNDVIFIYASVIDKNGTVIHHASDPITFSIDGDARLVGHNPIDAEAGIASVLVIAGQHPGRVTVTAESERLGTAKYVIDVIL